jgi:hypothetical protein
MTETTITMSEQSNKNVTPTPSTPSSVLAFCARTAEAFEYDDSVRLGYDAHVWRQIVVA